MGKRESRELRRARVHKGAVRWAVNGVPWSGSGLTSALSVWVPAPESNPSDVKGEGTRKNNMEITWTVREPPYPTLTWQQAPRNPHSLPSGAIGNTDL